MGLFDKIKGRRDEETVLLAKEHVKQCEALQHAGRIPEALHEAREALRLDPTNADAYYGLGRCCHYIARSQNAQAGGDIYFSAGLDSLDEAIQAFKEVVRLQPQAADAVLNLALAYDNRSLLEDAERCYREAMRLDPDGMDGADAHFNLALLIYFKAIGWAGMKQFPQVFNAMMGDPALERAFALAETGVKIGQQIVTHNPSYVPNLIQAHRRLGSWYHRHFLGSRAIPHFQALLRLDPKDAEARQWLELAARNTGRRLI
jgi:tetratricopeptide (TPR) repeat protein